MVLPDANSYYSKEGLRYQSLDYEWDSDLIHEDELEDCFEDEGQFYSKQSNLSALEDRYKTRVVYQFLGLRDQLSELCDLTDDWNSYGAEAPNQKSLAIATMVLLQLFQQDFLPNKVIPSADGGIAFVFLNNGKQADIEVFNDGEALVGIYHLDKDTEVLDLPDYRVEESIQKIYEFLY